MKISFFSSDPGNHKFIIPIMLELEDIGYECGLYCNWEETNADIYWFDFVDQNLVVATNEDAAKLKGKRIIARLHAIEYYVGYQHSVRWENVHDVIFVSEHMRDKVLASKEIQSRIHVVHNGIDMTRFPLKATTENKYVFGYCGNVVPDKGIIQMVDTFLYVRKKMGLNESKLIIKGLSRFERRQLEYLNYRKQQHNDCIFFEDESNDVEYWLEGIDYLWQPSYAESFSLIVGEALSRGITPLVNDFSGAESLWGRYVYKDVDDIMRMIANPISPEENRNFVSKYAIEVQMDKIRKIL